MTAVASRNVTFVSHSDQAGRSDGVQIMVHRGYAYIGHTFSNGITIMDVRDPKRPRVVDFIACPPNTRSIHLQTHDDLLLATNIRASGPCRSSRTSRTTSRRRRPTRSRSARG